MVKHYDQEKDEIVDGWRPFDTLEEMNETLIDNWNRVVKPADTVYHLGDAVMGKREETLPLLARLNGTIVLIPGNHDHVSIVHGEKMRAKWMPKYSLYMIIGHHEVSSVAFSSVLEAHGAPKDTTVKLCHFPYFGDHTPNERYTSFRPHDGGEVLLHGHLHSHHPIADDRPRMIDVGVDAWQYTPIHIERICQAIMELM